MAQNTYDDPDFLAGYVTWILPYGGSITVDGTAQTVSADYG